MVETAFDSVVTVNRRAPKLRRKFPALESESKAILRERNRAVFSCEPRRAELERRLLGLGGTTALLFLPDPLIGKLLDRGRYFSRAGALMMRGLPSQCHANALTMFVETRGDIRICTGYALSDDGLWRQHSWGVTSEDGRIVETTAHRVRYFGFLLDDAETAQLLLLNIGTRFGGNKRLKRVCRFIREFFDDAMVKEALETIRPHVQNAGNTSR
jgi:hypothetical protein